MGGTHKHSGLRVLAGPLAFALAWWCLAGFPDEQRRVGAVFVFAVALWVSEALPLAVTSLLSTAMLVAVAKIPEKEAFAAYGDPIVPLFIGSFLLAKAMETTGLSERIAWMVLSKRWASRTPSRLLLAIGSVACLISLFVSNTATTAMLLPVWVSILQALKVHIRGTPYAVALLLMLTWGSSVAVGVPVGTPPNLIGISLIEKATGQKIGFIEWMAFAMPVTVAMMLGSWLMLSLLYRRGAPETADEGMMAMERRRDLGPLSGGERATLAAFFVALALWVLPDLSAMALGPDHAFAKGFQAAAPPSVGALIGAGLLFLLPARGSDGSRTLTWRSAATIDWGTILLFGGGIALGQAMFQSGLAESLGKVAAQAAGAETVWAITALGIAAAIVLSELASNTAAATALVPIAIGLAEGAGVNPIPPALGVAIGASFGFMLPVSTPPNAIIYSSGLVPPREMMKAGLAIDVIGFFVTYGCLRLMLPALGLA